MRRLLILASAAMALCGCASLGLLHGDGERITAEGMAPISGNLPLARQNALAAAQRSAVEQVVGVFVSGQTQVQDAVAVRQKLLASTQGFIKSYKIVHERQSAGYYTVKIKAVVLVENISAAMEKLKADSRGKVALFSSSVADGKSLSPDDGSAPLSAELGRLGYQVVTPQPSDGSESSALDAAQAEHADFAVIAAASVYKLTPMPELGGQFSPFRARTSVKIYTAADRRLAAEITKEASGLDTAPEIAARKAVSAANALAAKALAQPLEKAANTAATVTLKITGLDGLAQLRQFQELLRGIPGVEKVALSTYSSGNAFFSLKVRSLSGEELASSILLHNMPFRLQTQNLTQYDIEMKAN